MRETNRAPTSNAATLQRPGSRHDHRLEWFRDARFGMFVHWGLYSALAGEWQGEPIPGIGEWIMQRARIPGAEYEQLAAEFNPVEFDAAQWVGLAKAAGQKYLTITAKHHDGFCMFGSETTDYTVVKATPFGRDPMQELARECADQGITLCFYYSQTQDWHHPGGDGNDWDFTEPDEKTFDDYVQDYVKSQLRELLTNYGPIGLIWFDTPRRISKEQSSQLVDFVHGIQPDCLVNGRIGNRLGDYGSAEDQTIPGDLIDMDWESCMTMNDTWGYKADDRNWKSSRLLVHQLIDAASRGGNYLLNVGPTSAGVIPQPSEERLRAIGKWLGRNGVAVYSTRPGPIQGVPHCRTTGRPGSIYVHVLEWPADGVVTLPHPGKTVLGAHLLHDPPPLEWWETPEGLVIQGPRTPPDPVATVITLDCTEAVSR